MDHSEPDPNNNGQGPLDTSNRGQPLQQNMDQQQQQSVPTGQQQQQQQQSVVEARQAGIPANITIDLATYQAMQQQGLLIQVPGSGQVVTVSNPNPNQQVGTATIQIPAAALNAAQTAYGIPQMQQQGVATYPAVQQTMMQPFATQNALQFAPFLGNPNTQNSQQQQQQQQTNQAIISFQNPNTFTATANNSGGNVQQQAGQQQTVMGATPIAALQLGDLERLFGQQVAATAAASQQQSPQIILTIHPVEGGGQQVQLSSTAPMPQQPQQAVAAPAPNAVAPAAALSQGLFQQNNMFGAMGQMPQQQQLLQPQFDPQTNSLWLPNQTGNGGGGGASAGLVAMANQALAAAAAAAAAGGGLGDGNVRPAKRQRVSQGRVYPLHLHSDEQNLSRYQCLARKQIEIFETTDDESGSNAQGRNRPIIPGQVGIRCKHCAHLPRKERKTGSVYYPSRLDGVYQTAQKIAVGHLCNHCHMVPKEIREQLKLLKDQKSSDGGGKRYWAEGMRSYNVYETGTDGLALRY